MNSEVLFMGGFLLLILAMLGLDLGIVNKKDHVVSVREALTWTCVWVGMALLFYLFIALRAEWIHGVANFADLQRLNVLHNHGLKLDAAAPLAENIEMYRRAMSLEYLTGYLIEKALSVDNIFVMIMIFMSFRVDPKYFHKILFWGIIGAVVLRFTFIFTLGELVNRYAWVLWIFGGILIWSGMKLFFEGDDDDEERDMKKHPLVKFISKRFRMTRKDYDGRFFVKLRKHWYITPLFLVLVVIEFSDVIFAVDSIPAIFGVTTDPYIVFFSNIFAILGLRSLFFVLSGVLGKLAYLKIGLAVLLTFIGVKMLLPAVCGKLLPMIGLEGWSGHIPTTWSLAAIVAILGVSIGASLLFPPREKESTSEAA